MNYDKYLLINDRLEALYYKKNFIKVPLIKLFDVINTEKIKAATQLSIDELCYRKVLRLNSMFCFT